MTSKSRLAEARGEVQQRGERIAELERAQRRLAHLYEISKLLTRFEGVDRAVPTLIALIAETIPLRSAIVILEHEDGGPPRARVWHAEGESEAGLQHCVAHAQAMYAYLVRSDARVEPMLDRRVERLRTPAPPVSPRAGASGSLVMLPLVVDRRPIFGALQLSAAGPLDEGDLVFINAAVNQLAIAIDRQSVIDATQTEALAREAEQRLVAQASAAVGGSLDEREILAALARLLVPRMADLCLVDELREDGTVEHRQVLFADADKQRDLAASVERIGPGTYPMPHARDIMMGRARLFSEITESIADGLALHDEQRGSVLRAVGVESLLVVPIVVRGRTVGVLVLATAESDRRYGRRDLALVEEVARRTAVAIDNAGLYAAARRATLARENLLAVVAHDLRNPLSAMLMGLNMLQRKPEGFDREKWLAQIGRIERSARRMNRLIDDLLDTASVEAGRLSIEPQPLDARVVVSEALEAARSLAQDKLVNLDTELSPALPTILADPGRVHQLLGNLVGNAIKFTRSGGTVTVRAERSGPMVVFAVADTGPGIPEEELPRLFDRFWQATRTARYGHGLGLFIAKGIAEAHGGKLWVHSEVGVGTTFFFTLPARPDALPFSVTAHSERATPDRDASSRT